MALSTSSTSTHGGLFALAASTLLAACSSPSAPAQAAAPSAPLWQDEPTPAPGKAEEFDWVRLTSGEWLKGEVEVLNRGTLEFDSEELDTLKLDWDDVAELRTSRSYHVLLDNRTVLTGRAWIRGDVIHVTNDAGTVTVNRSDVHRVIPEGATERSRWSGDIGIGATLRSGNTDQTDLSASFFARRRTPGDRLELDIDTVYSEVEGDRAADNQRFNGKYDVFLSPQLYLTPLGLEVYRDTFQNIRTRISPYTGIGYAVIDEGDEEWEVTGGLGYRYTLYESTPPSGDDSDETVTAIFGTDYRRDLTSRVDCFFGYTANISLEDVEDTNQTARAGLSVDLWGDLELDIEGRWNRVGDPEVDSSGEVPEKDDFQFIIGLSLSF